MKESSPVLSTEHVVIRAVYGHENKDVTHVIRGKSRWGRQRVRRDSRWGENKVYAIFESAQGMLDAVASWYTPWLSNSVSDASHANNNSTAKT